MHNKIKFCIITVLFLLLTGLVLNLPEAKYVSTKFISQLKLPQKTSHWHGTDVSDQLNIDLGNDTFNFISNAIAYNYQNKSMDKILLIILDAGNFHYPNVCMIKAGYEVTNLKRSHIPAAHGRSINAYSLYIEKNLKNEYFLILYWIVIDKEVVHNWLEQKVKQLFFSLFNNKRVGLMIRLDIPIEKGNIQKGLSLAKQFTNDLDLALPADKADYIFGVK